MKANLTITLKDIDGNEVLNEKGKKIFLNKFIAGQILSEEAKDNVLQKWELANKLNDANNEIDITESEKEIIKKICEKGRMSILVAAQILLIINNAK